jgi:hypothetical protein
MENFVYGYLWRNENKATPAEWLGLTDGAQPIFPKQLRFDPSVWKTCLREIIKNYAQTTFYVFKLFKIANLLQIG